MKKMEVKEVRREIMKGIMKKTREVMLKAVDEIDGTEKITEEEHVNNEKMLLMYEVVSILEDTFISLDKDIFKENK